MLDDLLELVVTVMLIGVSIGIGIIVWGALFAFALYATGCWVPPR